MDRLTEPTIGCFKYDLKDHKHEVGEFNTYDAFFDYNMAVVRLGEYENLGTPDEIAAMQAELKKLRNDEVTGLIARLPCKRGDVCYEVDAGHGIIKHVVKGLTVYNRGADGKRYMTDFNNVIVIDTWAVGDDGCEWPDQYSADEWANSIRTREEAEATLTKSEDTN